MLATGAVFLGWIGCATAEPPALAADPADSAEQRAFRIDSATGLLAAESEFQFLGTRSCVAAACHGGIAPDPRFQRSQRNEFTTFINQDPHAHAFRTLSSDRSERMLEALGIRRDGQVVDAVGLANCFACHNPQPADEQKHERFFTRDGVGCETCHGPAEKWVQVHHLESWDGQRQRTGLALGMVDTQDLLVRARLCAQCHVGSPGREVNHDLIAAGHPPLKFELAAYHDMLPKHWRHGRERVARSSFDLQLWASGQAASALAATELLEWRAERAATSPRDAVWPEFAEFDCFACHHDLQHPSWRQKSLPAESLGMADWGSWYFAMLARLSRDEEPPSMPVWSSDLEELTVQMQRGFYPDPVAVRETADKLRQGLQRWQSAAADPRAGEFLGNRLGDRLVPWAKAFESSERTRPIAGWDEATQIYLALVAWEQSHRDEMAKQSQPWRHADLDTAIRQLRGQLAFPPGYDSPKGVAIQDGTRDAVVPSLVDLILQLDRRMER